MRALVQRTGGSELWIDDKMHCQIGPGLMVLFGCRTGDREESCAYLADKTANLRIFEDEQGKMNRSVLELQGEIMVVSQFTLYADTRKGRRPAFSDAMEPMEAERLYDRYVDLLRQSGLNIRTGVFGAKMEIRFSNDGPVTILLEHDVS